MSDDNRASTMLTASVGRPSWLIFLLLATVFFFVYHDLSFSKKGIDNYNPSEEDLAAGVVDGSPVRRIALFSLGLFAIVSLVRHRAYGRVQISGFLGWILIGFAALALVSPIWAEDPALTFRRVLGLVVLSIAAIAVARRFSPREIVLWTVLTTTLFLAIGFSAEVLLGIFRPLASGYRFAGMLHPNGQGIDCGLLLISGVAAADLVPHRRKLFRACALLGFVFLLLTGSRTAFGAVTLALAVYSATTWSSRAKIATVYACGILFCVFLLVLANVSVSDLKSAVLLGRDDAPADSLNGRTGVWEEISPYIQQRPILGYGYGGFWNPTHMKEISADEKWGVPDSHSAYLDYLLALGAVGLVAYALVLVAGIRRAFRFQRLSRNPAFAFCGALLVFAASVGFLESAPAEPSLLMFLSIAVLARLALVCEPESRRSNSQATAT
jgi:exopolysaccharide production protein ExoQ